MRRRVYAPLALALTLALGTAGCTLSAEVATQKDYEPSDGVGALMGELAIRNVLLISNGDGAANLVMTVVNSGAEDVSLSVQYGDGASRMTGVVDITAVPPRNRIGDDDGTSIVIESDEVVPGGLFPVYFQYGDVPGKLLFVPVLDGSLPEYELFVP